jgi:hypothetical protein
MSSTRAFIVRPFGIQEGINFEEVERKLVAPALQNCGIEGRTTGEITRQGNIREDMFRLLVLSDIVIADVSIYNANVFYELGIRHGLQERHTFSFAQRVQRTNTRSICRQTGISCMTRPSRETNLVRLSTR